MKILFMRHAQDQDDVNNKYSGWSDSPLTESGKQTIFSKVEEIQNLHIPFHKIISSPLQRAYQSGQILSKELNIELSILESLKEWNKYGILTGIDKELANTKYPELVQNINETKYILGAERIEDLQERIEFTLNLLTEEQPHNIIVMSHGGFLSQLFKKYLKLNVKKTEDGGFYLSEFSEGKLNLLQTSGVEFE